jgi:hypothetical protein
VAGLFSATYWLARDQLLIAPNFNRFAGHLFTAPLPECYAQLKQRSALKTEISGRYPSGAGEFDWRTEISLQRLENQEIRIFLL